MQREQQKGGAKEGKLEDRSREQISRNVMIYLTFMAETDLVSNSGRESIH
jgi:hypothetical protein